MKRKALLVYLIASAPVSATEIDDLIQTSQSIRESFSYGIQAVGGMIEYAPLGGIAPTGTVDAGLITQAQADAYNQALQTLQNTTYSYDPGAQEYFDQQAEQSIQDMNQDIDNFVAAAQVLIEVATVNEMAQDAQTSGDPRDAIVIQEYAEANDVVLDSTEVDTYNQSLEAIEASAQTAAAYYAVAGDAGLIESANTAAGSMMVTYQEAAQSYFDASSGMMVVEWNNQTSAVMLDLADYFKTETDIITQGSQSEFFRTSPESGCWFIQDEVEREACMYGS